MGKHVRQARAYRTLTDLSGIGIAGCGRMGAPMLAALRRAGFDARGFDIRPRSEYGDLSGPMTDDPDAFSPGLRHLFTVVRDIPQTEEVLFTDQAFLTRAPDLESVIICSTLSPRYTRDLRTRVPDHIRLIDAPMSGAQIAAEDARLSFMLGGEKEDLDHLHTAFAAMGAHFHRMGPFGMGMQAKVLNNMLAAAHTALTRQVLGWAQEAGLEQRQFLDLVQTSSGQNWFASGYERIEFARDGFGEDNSIGILVKDVESALDALPEDADQRIPEAIKAVLATMKPAKR